MIGLSSMPLAAASAGNIGVFAGQNQVGGNGSDLFAATQGTQKGGMRGIGLIAAMVAEIELKKKSTDVAKSYYSTNLRDFNFFVATHEPAMSQSVSEARAMPQYSPDVLASLAGGLAKIAILDKQWFEARRRIPKYNIGQRRRLDYDMAVARLSAAAQGWNLAVRYETEWADQHNRRSFNRKLEMANIGVNVGNLARQGLGRASNSLATAYDGLGDTIASIGNGYYAKSGYEAGRNLVKQKNVSKDPTGMQP